MTSRPLVAVAAAQLVAGVTGQAIAWRRRIPYDVGLVGMHGQPERMERDVWLSGTGLSAPVTMLSLQTVAVARLASGPSTVADRVLGALGLAMVGGYLGERVVRQRLSFSGWDPVETPVVAVGLGLAGGMAWLGLTRPSNDRGATPA